MRVIIATKNQSKFDSTKKLLLLTDPSLQINQVSKTILAPIENNNSSIENSKLKLEYYGMYIHDPLIVCDDEILLIKDGVQLGFGTLFKRLGGKNEKNPVEIFSFLQKYIKDNPGLILTRKRYFSLKYLDKVDYIIDEYVSPLKTLTHDVYEHILKTKNKLSNPLNYYIIANQNNERLYQINLNSRNTYTNDTKKKLKEVILKWKAQYEK